MSDTLVFNANKIHAGKHPVTFQQALHNFAKANNAKLDQNALVQVRFKNGNVATMPIARFNTFRDDSIASVKIAAIPAGYGVLSGSGDTCGSTTLTGVLAYDEPAGCHLRQVRR